ncbi:DUF547 domain-containing protein [Tamlana fucoidanivorans]|uniref:DUF547 domain-containing protein n=1 Tax=Allotamlana fucoidanivorans TaxID=2583814 RepID=A0A5C4SJ96_9FLAO|nr:DUF547 domain-containing protein [Tamlana fucoidanivorans]TNJ43842.1 DUF547 domain-containing protein [Tamlana fucoidanivorans]
MKQSILFFVFLWAAFSLRAQNVEAFFNKTDTFLKIHVVNGKVAYEAIKKDTKALEELMNIGETISIEKSEELVYQSFWINAYNLAVIKGVVDNYPINSPLDVSGFFDKTTFNLASKKVTLNDIEHKLLRAQFNDARFHFVLVCGAIGCPPLISEAYLPETLETQLEQQTKLALNGDFIRVNFKKNRVEVSQIMEWYKEDFTMHGSTEIDFINQYRADVISSTFKLRYFPYNWSINKQ